MPFLTNRPIITKASQNISFKDKIVDLPFCFCFLQSEIMKEAKLMSDLQHRNIVRLIGVCKSDTLMLVMELAPLGPLNKYLKSHGYVFLLL